MSGNFHPPRDSASLCMHYGKDVAGADHSCQNNGGVWSCHGLTHTDCKQTSSHDGGVCACAWSKTGDGQCLLDTRGTYSNDQCTAPNSSK